MSAIIGAGSSVADGIMSLFGVKSANDKNIAMQRETNALQYQMMREQNEWNRQQAIDMFNLEANYNSPFQQMQRLEEAGINPNVAFGQNTSTTAGNTNASTPAAVGVPTPQAPRVSPLPSPLGNISSSILQVAQALGSVSQAKKTDAETLQIKQSLSAALRKLEAEADGAELANQIATIQRDADAFELRMSRQWSNRERAAKLKNIINDTLLKMSQKDLASAQERFSTLQGMLEDKKYQQFQKEMPLLIQQLQTAIGLANEQVKTEKARQKALSGQAAQGYAAAELSKENAETVRQLREYQVRLMQGDAKNRELQVNEYLQTLHDKVTRSGLLNDFQRQQIDLLSKQIRIAQKQGNWIDVQNMMSIVNNITTNFMAAPSAPSSSAASPAPTPYVMPTPTYVIGGQ